LVSGALYVPFEIHELIRRLSLFHLSLLVVNLAVVLYMVYLRILDQNGTETKDSPS